MALVALLTLPIGPSVVDAAQADTAKVPCSVPALITAINEANSTPGAHTLDLAGGCTYSLVAPDNAANGLPVVTSDITINGHHATITRDPSALGFRILMIARTGTLSLNAATISGGMATMDCPNAAAGVCGGGINNLGSLTVTNSRVVDNIATADALAHLAARVINNNPEALTSGIAAEGGGIANHGTATLKNTTIGGNTANYRGPAPSPTGIANSVAQILNVDALTSATTTAASYYNTVAAGAGIANRGSLTINTSRVTHNTVSVAAGTYSIAERAAVANFGSATISNSVISDNAAIAPEGIARAALGNDTVVATMTVTNTVISGNTASAPAGFVPGAGVAVSPSSTLTMIGVVINNNTASAPGGTVQGGGITNYNGTLNLTDSEVTDNTAIGRTAQGGGLFNAISGRATLTRTVVTSNVARGTTDSAGGGIFNANTADGSVALNDSNVSGNEPNNCTPSIGSCY